MNKKLYHMSELKNSKYTPSHFDVFIIVLETEVRGEAAIAELARKGIEISHLVLIHYNEEKTKHTHDLIYSKCPQYAGSHIDIKCDIYDPYEFINAIEKAFIDHELTKSRSIGLDITCIPIPLFFMLVDLLFKIDSSLHIYYTEPENYLTTDGLYSSYVSYEGSIETREIDGFAGLSVKEPAPERILFCVLGFDKDVLPGVINAAAPNKFISINGFPSTYPKYKDISLINNARFLEKYSSMHARVENKQLIQYAQANNPFEMVNVLEHMIEMYSKYNIDIIPLSTKPLALGVCLCAIENRRVRVLFPFPETYRMVSSSEFRTTWEYVIKTEIPLEHRLDEMIEADGC